MIADKHNAPIHLVITDVVMPEMGGAELFRHLRRWYPTMRIFRQERFGDWTAPLARVTAALATWL